MGKIVCACEDNYQPAPGDLSVSGEMPGYVKGLGKANIPPQMMAMMQAMGCPPSAMGKMFGKAAVKAKGMSKSSPPPYGGNSGGTPGMGPRKPTGTGQFMTGTVKSFNPTNNYGFIASDEAKAAYGGDVFCGMELANFPVGSAVLFQ